jgi:tetratricopeptide (TPR) repeat protein
MAELYADQGQFAESLKYSEQRIALVEQFSYPALLTFALSRHSDITFVSGDWTKARHICERALALCKEAGVAAWQARIVLLPLSRLCLAEVRWEQGQAYLTAALAEAERFIFRNDLWEGQALQAEYHLYQGRFQEARACLEPLRDQWKNAYIDWLLFPLLAWALLELGEEAEAEALMESSLARTRARKKYFVLADGLLILARLRLAQHRWLETARTLDEVLTLAQSMPAPYTEAKALYLYGLLHKAQGEAEPARERLEAALVILRKLGERLYAGKIERLLAPALNSQE